MVNWCGRTQPIASGTIVETEGPDHMRQEKDRQKLANKKKQAAWAHPFLSALDCGWDVMAA